CWVVITAGDSNRPTRGARTTSTIRGSLASLARVEAKEVVIAGGICGNRVRGALFLYPWRGFHLAAGIPSFRLILRDRVVLIRCIWCFVRVIDWHGYSSA